VWLQWLQWLQWQVRNVCYDYAMPESTVLFLRNSVTYPAVVLCWGDCCGSGRCVCNVDSFLMSTIFLSCSNMYMAWKRLKAWLDCCSGRCVCNVDSFLSCSNINMAWERVKARLDCCSGRCVFSNAAESVLLKIFIWLGIG